MMQIHSHEKANIDKYNAILATKLAILGRRVRPRPLKDGKKFSGIVDYMHTKKITQPYQIQGDIR